jgi:hypothetical protein
MTVLSKEWAESKESTDILNSVCQVKEKIIVAVLRKLAASKAHCNDLVNSLFELKKACDEFGIICDDNFVMDWLELLNVKTIHAFKLDANGEFNFFWNVIDQRIIPPPPQVASLSQLSVLLHKVLDKTKTHVKIDWYTVMSVSYLCVWALFLMLLIAACDKFTTKGSLLK